MSRRAFCDDWSCPSMWTCARAFGRSEIYWRFSIDEAVEDPADFYKGPRKPGFDACDDYEHDKPREWLKDVFTPQIPMARPDIPAGFRIYAIEGGRA